MVYDVSPNKCNEMYCWNLLLNTLTIFMTVRYIEVYLLVISCNENFKGLGTKILGDFLVGFYRPLKMFTSYNMKNKLEMKILSGIFSRKQSLLFPHCHIVCRPFRKQIKR